MKARHVYTPEERARGLDLYVKVGPCQAARELGMAKSTLTNWAKAAGLKPPDDKVNRINEATEVHGAKTAQRRAELKALLIERALDLIDRMDQEHIDYKSAGAAGPQKVTFPKAPASACLSYATAIGILIDKFRLENGEVTGREEVVTIDAIDREIQELERELARRGALNTRTPEPAGELQGEA